MTSVAEKSDHMQEAWDRVFSAVSSKHKSQMWQIH